MEKRQCVPSLTCLSTININRLRDPHALGYAAHKLIQSQGGYQVIAEKTGIAAGALKGRMIDAIRRAALKVANAEI
jgi:hypothetical protein